ncbi:SDR family oxidoreductase [Frankia sp. AgB1.9]|uniref:SDR family oxidoreductase n=1 Tax=unclassified Frankia TaxID=2632575 RepID=UPI001931996D|nr:MULTISPECIES: SDR family oxidoreductase [unclassified Frankia]MBL7491161.1 SDR family oxidoreductase [Frankia sp. AgW1.1]MBL7548759.1 SDR family oxidoreductase [Frankia sp. AgB1.9]MBL7623909.1 SDR family oxidoreductase [Frankia sp. AgB1.8]
MVSRDVAVIIGVGGMGTAIARRLGSGRRLLLADRDERTLKAARDALAAEGHEVAIQAVDVAEPESMASLAATAGDLGPVTHLAHTAGLSPVQAKPADILRVDLLGVALFLDDFAGVVAPGGAGVVIASTAGHFAPTLTPDQETALALTPAAELARLPFLSPDLVTDQAQAYCLAKVGNLIRVRAAAKLWGRRDARVNSVSPGVVSTPMGRQELAGPWGAAMQAQVDSAPAKRVGTPDDVADAVSFLLGQRASFITGTDLVVDGGAVAIYRRSGWTARAKSATGADRD